MKDANTYENFLSKRLLWGFLAGLTSWLVLALFLKMPLGYSPVISVIMAMLTSRFYEPKRLAGLSAGIGEFAGLVYGMQSIFQVFSPIDFERIVFSPFFIGISMLFSGLFLRSLALSWEPLPGCTKRGVFFSLLYRKQLLAWREA